MNMINPYILLGIGTLFALLYAGVIIVGWWRTRLARQTISEAEGVKYLPVYLLDKNEPAPGKRVKCVSLTANRFEDSEGNPIDITLYDAYIAEGESSRYPDVHEGYLLLFDSQSNQLRYAFATPMLKDYR